MRKLISLILMTLMISSCELTPPIPSKPAKTKPVYPGWDDSLSKVICYTNGVTLRYDNRLNELKIGVHDATSRLTDYKDSLLAELINVDQENIEGTTVYYIVYVIGGNTFKYRMRYGLWESNNRNSKIHNAPEMKEKGYKPMKGMLSKNGEVSENISFCWGINEAGRKIQALKPNKSL